MSKNKKSKTETLMERLECKLGVFAATRQGLNTRVESWKTENGTELHFFWHGVSYVGTFDLELRNGLQVCVDSTLRLGASDGLGDPIPYKTQREIMDAIEMEVALWLATRKPLAKKTKPKLKLYVWDNVFTDYYPGMAVALAESAAHARDILVKVYCVGSPSPTLEARVRSELEAEPQEFSDAPVGFIQPGGS